MPWKFFTSSGKWITTPSAEADRLTGSVLMHGSATAPSGWLLCNGASYLVSAYTDLFNVIGYVYGGSGLNFNVPNLSSSRFPLGSHPSYALGSTGGSTTHSHTALHSHDAPPAHDHTFPGHNHNVNHSHSTTPHRHGGADNGGNTILSANPSASGAKVDSGANFQLADQTPGSRHTHNLNGNTAYNNPSLIYGGSSNSGGYTGSTTLDGKVPDVQPATITTDGGGASPEDHRPLYLPVSFIIKI